MNKIKILSLFSGIGAFEKALTNIEVEHEIVNYCEIDKFASFAYSILHNVNENLNLGDISKVDSTKLGNFDLLTYGFPCQDISLSGKMKGIIKGKTRSGLLYEALRIIESKKPKFAIAENVRNLVSRRFKNEFETMLKELDELGYNSYWKVLNAKDYGSPQARERVFIVSIRKDVDNGKFKFPEPINKLISLNNILDSKVDNRYYCSNKYIRDFIKDTDRKILGDKVKTKTGLFKIGDIKNPNKFNMNNRVFSSQGTCPTILTGSDSVPRIMEYKIRKLTPCECWKATGFTEENYCTVKTELIKRFYKGVDRTDTQMYKMAGNSIVVNVLEEIFKELFK